MAMRTKLLTAFLGCCLASGAALAWKTYPDQTDDGLDRINVAGVDAMYWKEGATLKGYKRIRIADCKVAFKKNWLRDQNSDRLSIDNRIEPQDMEKIEAALAKSFRDEFTKELEKGGYKVVNENGNDVLLLEPKIVDLDVNAPDISMRQTGRVNTYTTSAGEMTLQLDFIDSASQSLIGRAIDKREDNSTGSQIKFTNSITNRADADRILRSWASRLVKALDSANEVSK